MGTRIPMDVVFPQGNEERLAQMAKRLGTREVLYCYGADDPQLKLREKELDRLRDDLFTPLFGIHVSDARDIDRVRHISSNIVGPARLFEDRRVRFLIDAESGKRDDFIHHRNAGLTQVHADHARDHGQVVLINLAQLYTDTSMAVTVGRMRQNIVVARKRGTQYLVISGASEPLLLRAPRDRLLFLREDSV